MQVPADNPRSHLVPEGELLRYRGVLIDASLDLERAVDELFLWELVGDQLAVMRRVAPAASHAIMFSRWLGTMGSIRMFSACCSPGSRMII